MSAIQAAIAQSCKVPNALTCLTGLGGKVAEASCLIASPVRAGTRARDVASTASPFAAAIAPRVGIGGGVEEALAVTSADEASNLRTLLLTSGSSELLVALASGQVIAFEIFGGDADAMTDAAAGKAVGGGKRASEVASSTSIAFDTSTFSSAKETSVAEAVATANMAGSRVVPFACFAAFAVARRAVLVPFTHDLYARTAFASE